LIELAYRLAEAAGVPLWCQDEAGPYQAIPHAGAGWAPVGAPRRLPHEYVRGGTAKLLTLFRPGTGEVRAQGVTQAPNTVLHPWVREELTQVLATLPDLTSADAERPELAQWATWLGHAPPDPLPPLRLILVWDNLAGHHSWVRVRWLLQHGIMPLYTPLSGRGCVWPRRCSASSSDGRWPGSIPRVPSRSSRGWRKRWRAGTPPPPPSSGMASAANAANAPATVASAAPRPP
jgi:hypothetical protein